jgi:nucleoside-diphosphate-sugar epimerase
MTEKDMSIRVIITGSTGMVGRGVLLECLESPDVESILLVSRKPCDITHRKIRDILHRDFSDFSSIRDQLRGYDACFFCLGVSALGMSEERYTDLTYSLTRRFAEAILQVNPGAMFVYVSGTGTDSSERGRTMWARIKGKTENAVLSMGFRDAYAFRPGLILPEKGVKSRTAWYSVVYVLLKPFFPLLKKSESVTTTAKVGQAMINAAISGCTKKHLENKDINLLASGNPLPS